MIKENIKSVYGESTDNADSGLALIEYVLLGVAIVGATLFVGRIIAKALINAGADTAACIQGSNPFDLDSSWDECTAREHSTGDSRIENDSAYQNRFSSGE